MICLAAASCVVPIPASPDEEDLDAGGSGGNGYPVVAESNPPMPGPINLRPDKFPVSVTLKDSNIGDTLYIRVFREYAKDPRPPVNDRMLPNDPRNGTEERAPLLLETDKWCLDVTVDQSLVFEVVVADRPFDPSPTALPIYKAVTAGGKSSTRAWIGKCVQPI